MEVVLYALFVVAWATLWAVLDRKVISKGKRILHALRWCLRAGLVIAVAAGFAHKVGNWWSILPLLTMGAFLFSLTFRLKLNALRGKQWAYVGPWSNVYDRVFYTLVWFVAAVRKAFRARSAKEFLAIIRSYIPDAEALYVDRHLYAAPSGMVTRTMIHRAGLIALTTEITLTILSAYVVGIMKAL